MSVPEEGTIVFVLIPAAKSINPLAVSAEVELNLSSKGRLLVIASNKFE